MNKAQIIGVTLAAVVIIGVVALYLFLTYAAVEAITHTDATVNVLGAILIAILINGIGNGINSAKSGTGRR